MKTAVDVSEQLHTQKVSFSFSSRASNMPLKVGSCIQLKISRVIASDRARRETCLTEVGMRNRSRRVTQKVKLEGHNFC